MTEVTEAMIAAGLTYDLKTWRRAGDDDAYYSALYREMEAARIPAAPDVERGARAMWEVTDLSKDFSWDELDEDVREGQRVALRAALSAIPIPAPTGEKA